MLHRHLLIQSYLSGVRMQLKSLTINVEIVQEQTILGNMRSTQMVCISRTVPLRFKNLQLVKRCVKSNTFLIGILVNVSCNLMNHHVMVSHVKKVFILKPPLACVRKSKNRYEI